MLEAVEYLTVIIYIMMLHLEHHIIIIKQLFCIIIIIEQHIYIFYGYIYIFFNVFETLDSVNLLSLE